MPAKSFAQNRGGEQERNRLVERRGEPAPRVASQRVLHAQLVENTDHHAADIVAGSVGVRDRGQEHIQGMLVIAAIEGGEGLVQIGYGTRRRALRGSLQADPRGQPVGGKASWHPRQHRERLVGLATAPQDPGQRHGRVGARRLELVGPAQRFLIALLHQSVGFRWEQRVEEVLNGARRLSPGELGCHLPVAERLDRRDPLDPERSGQALIGVDVDLDQLALAGARGSRALEHRTQLAAGTAPFGPEIDHDRQRVRAVDNRSLKIRFGHVHACDGSDAARPGNLTSTSISPHTQNPDDATILVDDLVVRFGEVVAVAGVSFAVRPGEAYGLLGPNGAGKTTTVRVLATLLPATEGRALVAGYDVQRHGLAVRASIGYIPQALSADGALTARENLEFYARVTGVPRAVREERIAEAVEAMEIGGWLDRLARTLSGGMLRRLEIGTALLNRPRVLLLDEPTVGLDPNARRVVWERLDALREQAGTTILVTTHLMEEAERHCDRLAIMDQGVLVAQGTPAELIAAHDASGIEDVFVTVTGRTIQDGGSIRDVRRQRRIAGRLG